MFLAACDTMTDRWQTDSGRLGNLINPVFLALLPKWVFNVLSGVFIFIMMHFAVKVANVTPGGIRSYLLVSVIVFCFPWYDYMFCTTFALCYVWAIALSLITTYYLLRTDCDFHGLKLVGLCLLCFITGWFHEGIGAPLAFGMAAVTVIKIFRGSLKRNFLLPVICLCVGTVMICLSPVFWNRAETEVSNIYKFPIKEMIMQIGPGIAMFLTFIAGLVILMLNKGVLRKVVKDAQALSNITFYVCFLLMSLFVMIKYYNGPRVGAGVVVYSGVGLIYLTGFTNWKEQAIVGLLIKAFSAILIFVNLISAITLQKQLRSEFDTIVSMFQNSSNGTIYYDLTYPNADLSLYKTTVRQFHERIPKFQFSHYYDPDKRLVILPSRLEGLEFDKLQPTSGSPKFYSYKGCFVMVADGEIASPQIWVKQSNNEWHLSRYRLDNFMDKNGTEWIWIMPHIQVLDETLELIDIKEQE